MAKDKENINPEEEALNEEVDETTGEEEEQDENKLKSTFRKFHEGLKEDEIPAAQNQCDVEIHNLEKAQKSVENTKKYLDKSGQALSVYEQIKYEIALNFGQDTIELQNDIVESKGKFQEMDKLFGEGIGNIKQVGIDILGIKSALDKIK